MAWFRFALAIEVVCFHTGMGQIAGPVAVIAFFVLSGFLIARVLEENYLARVDGAWSGAGRFYVNRLLRLGPAFLTVSLAMMIACVGAQHAPLHLTPAQLPPYASSILYSGHALHTYVNGVEPHIVAGWAPVPHIFTGFVLIPQYWTVAFEVLFYAVAPLLIFLTLRTGRRTYALAFALAAAFYIWATAKAWHDPAADNMLIYRNGLSMFVFFFWGASLYAISRMTTWRFPLRAAMAVAVVYLLAIGGAWYLRDSFAHSWIISNQFWHLFTIAALVPIVLCEPIPRRFAHVDRYLGDLSYGIYISHFLAITLLQLPAARYAAVHHAAFTAVPTFGGFGVNEWVFRLLTILLAIAIAVPVLHLVERPVERLRRRVGSRRPDGGAVAPEHDAADDERSFVPA
jgi:peptidoglycan/LPS O-acetylase OafA/YrhL